MLPNESLGIDNLIRWNEKGNYGENHLFITQECDTLDNFLVISSFMYFFGLNLKNLKLILYFKNIFYLIIQ